MVNSRRKGHDAELKVAAMLHRHSGQTFTQTPGSGSGKIKGDLYVPHKHNIFTIIKYNKLQRLYENLKIVCTVIFYHFFY